MKTISDKVLVVDDENIVCQNCEKILKEEGFSINTALSGEECLKLVNERKYDAIILDLKIPDINGMKLLKEIKGKMPNIIVIIMTGYSSLESAVEAMKLGASDYIAKPFTPDELSLSLKKALEKRTVVAGEGDIVEPLIKKAELKEEIERSKYTTWTPAPSRPAYFSEWMGVRIGKDDTARIVLNDLFFKLKGKVKYIDFPKLNQEIETTIPCFRIFYTSEESYFTKVEKVCSPISGKVIEINPLAMRKINIVNDDPFSSGWLIRIVPARFYKDLGFLKSGKILIADDDERAIESIVNYFKEDIYEIYITKNFQDLNEGLKKKRYDVAILGKNVHGEPVHEAAKYIRFINKEIPIITVTEDDSIELARRVREYNIFYYDMKPLDEVEIKQAVRNAFTKIELKEQKVEEPFKFDLFQFIKSVQMVNHSGKHVAIIGLGDIFNEDNCIGQILVDRLKKKNLPVNLQMGSRELLGKEIMPYLERNDKIIIVNGIEMSISPGEIKKYSKTDIRINQIGYPEVMHWANAIGMDPEVVVIGIQTHKCGFGKERFSFTTEQNRKITEEILSEVLN